MIITGEITVTVKLKRKVLLKRRNHQFSTPNNHLIYSSYLRKLLAGKNRVIVTSYLTVTLTLKRKVFQKQMNHRF